MISSYSRRPLRIALIHDWVTGLRGGERVLDALASHFPEAELHTLIYRPGRTTPSIDQLRVFTSRLDRLPGIDRHYRKLLPLYPWAAGQLHPTECDLVISISHAIAKSIHIPPETPHLCYCLTPMRYIWDQADAYLGTGVRRGLAKPLISALRNFDRNHSQPEQVTRFTSISREVSRRIQAHYGRPSEVVHPPVNVERFQIRSGPPEDFYLLVGAFVPYKREALAIEAFRRNGRRLVVAGDGPLKESLRRQSPPNVEFVGRVSDEALADLMSRCRALIHPQHEDFGIVAVEAQAAGRPVIAYGAGGALDTVRPLSLDEPLEPSTSEEPTGIFFSEQTPQALESAIRIFENNAGRFQPTAIRRQAQAFGRDRFLIEFDQEIQKTLDAKTPD